MTVRLTDQQIKGITTAVSPFIAPHAAALFLYGSRTDLSAKGGDIDLLLVFEDAQSKLACQKNKHNIIAGIKKNIGDQKVDLLLACKDELEADSFLKLIFKDAVVIEW